MSERRDNLTKYIQDNISYDATLSYHCDRCGNEEKRYWIDHKDSLASGIADKLDFRRVGDFRDILEEVDGYTHGDKAEDAARIVQKIEDEICGLG